MPPRNRFVNFQDQPVSLPYKATYVPPVGVLLTVKNDNKCLYYSVIFISMIFLNF